MPIGGNRNPSSRLTISTNESKSSCVSSMSSELSLSELESKGKSASGLPAPKIRFARFGKLPGSRISHHTQRIGTWSNVISAGMFKYNPRVASRKIYHTSNPYWPISHLRPSCQGSLHLRPDLGRTVLTDPALYHSVLFQAGQPRQPSLKPEAEQQIGWKLQNNLK